MADRVLLVSWGMPVRGREERALAVFNETMGMYGRMQQEGRIEGFDVTLFEPNGALKGFIELRGSAEQIAQLRESEDFRRATTDATLIVDDLRLTDGYTGAGVARQIALYQEAISGVPQAV